MGLVCRMEERCSGAARGGGGRKWNGMLLVRIKTGKGFTDRSDGLD